MKNRLFYSELISIPDYHGRLEYLKLDSSIGEETFGADRYFNQKFYRSSEWKRLRNQVILRDNGCDLAIPELTIENGIYIHHLNPITLEEINYGSSKIFDLENLVCCSFDTHNMIHFGILKDRNSDVVERFPNDTCPWKRSD